MSLTSRAIPVALLCCCLAAWGLAITACSGADEGGAASGDPIGADVGEKGDGGAELDVAEDPGPREDRGTDEADAGPVDPGEQPPDEAPQVDEGSEPDTYVAPPEPCYEGQACDDGDPCTHSDLCEDEVCKGERYSCSDGQSCTHDICDGSGGCRYPIRPDRCLIDGACYEDGDPNLLNPCEACIAPSSNTAWTPTDSVPCDDEDFCTISDVCVGGSCVGLLPRPCDDENFCTDDDCHADKGCVHTPNERPCSDGDRCTIGDKCKNATCFPGGTVVTCNDKNICTNDICHPESGCAYIPNAQPCDDGSICTEGDVCAGGVCTPGSREKPCGDTNPCTDDWCHRVAGCQHTANKEPCDDNNPCTDGDHCAYAQCMSGVGMPNCKDGTPCTVDDCDPAVGCVYEPVEGEVTCDDGNPCTVGDFCEGGACKSGGMAVDCDDEDVCTDDACDENGDCVHYPADRPCDDEDTCTLNDRCREGICQPGRQRMVCIDDDPCTAEYCDPVLGCVAEPTDVACNDGNACTVGDRCLNGVCIPGNLVEACDDGNPCTRDECHSDKGCVFIPDDGFACDDGNSCTYDDICQNGACQGQDSPCDDGNICTEDLCFADGECQNVFLDTPFCRPEIVITYPPRGAMIVGPPDEVTVTGYVTSQGGGITEFLINDQPVHLFEDGSFAHTIVPHAGTNVLRSVAGNQAGGQYAGVRAFQFSHHYYPAHPETADAGRIPNGIRIYLGEPVWDDDDTFTRDDFATLILLMLGDFDIASMIPDPLAKTKVAWCKVTVRAKNIHYNGPDLDLKPTHGGLHAEVRLTNFRIDIDANTSGFLCPDLSGDVSASRIAVGTDMLINVPAPGVVEVQVANPYANVDSLDISLDGLLGFLFNWLIDLFSDTIADQLEAMVVGQIQSFAPMLQDALASFDLEQDIEIPPLMGSGNPTTVHLSMVVGSAEFDTLGGVIGMSVSATAPKGITRFPLGSISRSECLRIYEEPFAFIEIGEVEMGISDDMINQIVYATWYGGALKFAMTADDFPDLKEAAQYGISDMQVDVDMLLPPMVTDCFADRKFRMQIGDVHIHSSFVMLDQPLVMDAYASASANLMIDVVNTPTGPELAFGIWDLEVAQIEVETVTGGLAQAKAALTELIQDTMLPVFFEQLAGGTIATFPLPEIDLSEISSGTFPPGTSFKFEARKIYRGSGFSVVSGDVK